ncbi:hypothetical protein Btru_057249 [Bulinus truncatus]|nr:hypothetical protein Btru_057249 [Bulinus truncatus]
MTYLRKKMESKAHIAKLWFWPSLAMILAIISICLTLALIVVTNQKHEPQADAAVVKTPVSNTPRTSVCGATNPNGNTIDLTEPSLPGPFHDLTAAEIKKLQTFLENHPDIRAAKPGAASLTSSYIFMMDLMLPSKSEVLSNLDNSGDIYRSARVIMFRGDKSPPVVEEYKCGPLRNLYSCTILRVTDTNTANPMEFSLRPVNQLEIGALKNLLIRLDAAIGPVLRESYDATFTECDQPEDCFKIFASPVGSQLMNDTSQRGVWIFPLYNVPYYLLHPLGMGVLCQLNGADPTKWTYSKVWYNGQMYNSVTDFKYVYSRNTINKIKMSKPSSVDSSFSTLNQKGNPLPVMPQRSPTEIEPDGKRYSLKNKKVNYLNWSFNFRMSPVSGPALYDVRFKGERIAYEIALSEMATLYSGISPWPQTSGQVSSSSMIGLQYRSLVPGGDCPDTATLIKQTFYNQYGESPSVSYISFCLFEHNNGLPLRRHLSYTFNEGNFYGGMLDSVLILRAALTVINSDYIVDFVFHQNGALETRVMISGYIQTIFYQNAERPYGFQLGDTIIGNLHHHLVNFKVDLDIAGITNRYQTLDIVPEVVKRTDDPTKDFYQNKIVQTLKTSELDALYLYNFSAPKQHIVFNNAAKNVYNENRGYRIHIEGMSKSLLPQDVDNERSIPWARHQMVVTKQKDSEIRSSSMYAVFDSKKPATNFTSFYSDNENIVDEDLVLWITCGTHHVPHSEDLPVRTTVGGNMGFYLLPFNYHNECPSMSSRDALYIHRSFPSVTVERNNNSASQCLTPQPSLENSLASQPDQILESNHDNYNY